jgi:hypothetical protein
MPSSTKRKRKWPPLDPEIRDVLEKGTRTRLSEEDAEVAAEVFGVHLEGLEDAAERYPIPGLSEVHSTAIRKRLRLLYEFIEQDLSIHGMTRNKLPRGQDWYEWYAVEKKRRDKARRQLPEVYIGLAEEVLFAITMLDLWVGCCAEKEGHRRKHDITSPVLLSADFAAYLHKQFHVPKNTSLRVAEICAKRLGLDGVTMAAIRAEFRKT